MVGNDHLRRDKCRPLARGRSRAGSNHADRDLLRLRHRTGRAVCQRTNCVSRLSGKPHVYVGQTNQTPEERFAEHLAGGFTSVPAVLNYGIRLRPRLYRNWGPYQTREDALDAEARLAEETSDEGLLCQGWPLMRPQSGAIASAATQPCTVEAVNVTNRIIDTLPPDSFQAICLHEAAHAAVALALGLTVDEVCVTGTMRLDGATEQLYGLPGGSRACGGRRADPGRVPRDASTRAPRDDGRTLVHAYGRRVG